MVYSLSSIMNTQIKLEKDKIYPLKKYRSIATKVSFKILNKIKYPKIMKNKLNRSTSQVKLYQL